MDVHQLNVEIGIFLRQMQMQSRQGNIQINEKTAELLVEVISCIDQLTANAEMVPTVNKDSVDYLFDLNEDQFDLRHYIMCRLCVEQIGISKDEHDAHMKRNAIIHKAKAVSKSNTMRLGPGEDGGQSNGTNLGSTSSVEVSQQQVPSKVQQVLDQADDHGSNQNASHTVNLDSTYFIQAKGIPWIATKCEIIEFMDDVKVLNGANGIHFMIDETKNSHNTAIIQLASEHDYRMALSKKGARMGYANITFSKSGISDYMYLMSSPTYPSEQRVLRLEKLPPNCIEQDIRNYFNGQSISRVHFVRDRMSAEAFVVFANVDEVELALENVDNKKIGKVKIFRSSEKQMRHYCDTTITKDSDNAPSMATHLKPKSNSSNNVQNASNSGQNNNSFHAILARGFPWNVKVTDVKSFFNNVNIVGGVGGIQIKKNIAMEATFFVHSNEDVQKAMTFNNKKMNSRAIRVTRVSPYKTALSMVSTARSQECPTI